MNGQQRTLKTSQTSYLVTKVLLSSLLSIQMKMLIFLEYSNICKKPVSKNTKSDLTYAYIKVMTAPIKLKYQNIMGITVFFALSE